MDSVIVAVVGCSYCWSLLLLFVVVVVVVVSSRVVVVVGSGVHQV